MSPEGSHVMPRVSPFAVVLTEEKERCLQETARKYTSPYCDVIRAKVVLPAAEGLENTEIAARPPNLHPPPLMDMDFAAKRRLVRRRMPPSGSCPSGRDCRSRSRSRLGRVHLSDPASRRRPCGSLALHLHQVVRGTCTPRLSNMLGTRLRRRLRRREARQSGLNRKRPFQPLGTNLGSAKE